MTKESKQKFFAALDLLNEIGTAREVAPANIIHHGKCGGGSLHCDVCNGALYEANQHSPECPVGNAIKAMSLAITAVESRDQWMADDTQPNITFTPPVQPNP